MNHCFFGEMQTIDMNLLRLSIATWLILGLCTLNSCHPAGDANKKRIDVSKPDKEIKKELESYTPPGSSAAAVLRFIHTELAFEANMASGIGVIEGWSGITLTLGTRAKKQLWAHEAVVALWNFDSQRILRNIQVERHPQEGGRPPLQGQPPKVFIDPRWSDAKIREELLGYAPIGTPFRKVSSFPSRLNYAGGPAANPMPWIGKPDQAVVLAILPKDGGVYTDVRVIWVKDNQSKLADIEIQRVEFVPKTASEEN